MARAVGLPDDFQIRDLRRTGATEAANWKTFPEFQDAVHPRQNTYRGNATKDHGAQRR
jgi:hypothetical protein